MRALAYLTFTRDMDYQPILTAVVVVLCALPWRNRLAAAVKGGFQGMARRRGVAVALVGVVSLLVTAGMAGRRGIPLPVVHDEFSYLLAADTFAHGRLTNPTPPAWEHLESMHILVRPTYMSKYPPGQGLFMALGQVLTGKPIWGVWLSTALACAALAWMLRAFVPASWALGGGLLVAIHPQILEWGQRYWGGNVAVLGGALLLGGAARLRSRPLAGSIVMAAGMLILANSRPFEGLVMTVLVLAWGVWGRRGGGDEATERRSDEGEEESGEVGEWGTGKGDVAKRRERVLETASGEAGGVVVEDFASGPGPQGEREKDGLARASSLRLGWVVVGMLVVLIPGGVWMGYYNWRVTGSPLRLPYLEHHAQYATVPLLIVQNQTPTPVYRHREMERFQVQDQEYIYNRRQSWYGLQRQAINSIGGLVQVAFGHVEILLVPLMIVPWMLRTHRTLRALVLMLLGFAAVLLLETYLFGHYAAPAAGVVVAIVLVVLHHLWQLGQPIGRLLVRISLATCVLWSLLWWQDFFVWKQEGFAVERHRVERELAERPGKHLVIVRYQEHNVHEEWVYNAADLDSAKVVWARAMNSERDRQLMASFQGRRVWLIEPDARPLRLSEVRGGT